MEEPSAIQQKLIQQTILALYSGDVFRARKYAMRAALLAPTEEIPWLLMAAVVSPKDSLPFFQKALQINPQSQRARMGQNAVLRNLGVENETPPSTSVTNSDLQSEVSRPVVSHRHWTHLLRHTTQRLGYSLLILLAVAFLTLLGLVYVEAVRQGVMIHFLDALLETLRRISEFLLFHPSSYVSHKVMEPALGLVLKLFINSAGLLLLSLMLATLLGGLMGIAAAVSRRNIAPLMVFLSMLGISTPSFLLAMLLWVADFRLYNLLNLSRAPFPPIGFGWDAHLVMPVMVLAARPMAQIMQMMYISMSSILDEDFLRVARAKGISNRLALLRHALPNVFIPLLTTMGTSLRFSLASLPVVESFFLWPGLGIGILTAIEENQYFLVTDLVISLGIFFLLINFGLDFLYPYLDPRLQKNGNVGDETPFEAVWDSPLQSFWTALRSGWLFLAVAFRRRTGKSVFVEKTGGENEDHLKAVEQTHPLRTARSEEEEKLRRERRVHLLRCAFSNAPFVLGTLLALVLLGLLVLGGSISQANPYETHGVMRVEGVISAPPFKPSTEFPWGSDAVGRDIQALVLNGARQTLTLAVLATLARVLVGTLIGVLAGWWQNSWLDRLVNGLISIWAAFPVTIFAMIVILALGIQRGRSVFIIALCVVGWAEIAQFVRGQVIAQKPLLYIEAVRSIGAQVWHVLIRYVLPYLLPSILVLTVMEMGGVLMLLAELGFLNIFLGGGFRAQIGEGASMMPVIYYFSDIPEWGAMLSNIRNWWRSYPWMAWYPGLFFFLSIFTFNLWGEGLRRFVLESRLNLNRLLNRYTLIVGALMLAGVYLLMRATTPIGVYTEQAHTFDPERALQTIQALTSPEIAGRETGTPGAKIAAELIARQMEEIGLFVANPKTGYIQTASAIFPHLSAIPRLAVDGFAPLMYHHDYAEYTERSTAFGEAQGRVVGMTIGPGSDVSVRSRYAVRDSRLRGNILIVRASDIRYFSIESPAGLLVVADDPAYVEKKFLYARENWGWGSPALVITPQLGDALLKTAGSSLEDLAKLAESLPPNQIAQTAEGVEAALSVKGIDPPEDHYTVIGVLPGSGAQMRTGAGGSMDRQIIIVSAYFDGLGTAPDGTLYPGANDNASGVASMLELARALKNSPYPPEKTILFIAWSSGERHEDLSVTSVLNSTVEYNHMTTEAVFQLSGMGAGDGNAVLVGGSSYRLVKLYEQAARSLGYKTVDRGRDPHFGMYASAGFGELHAMTAYVSWDGSDQLAHTPEDHFGYIDVRKLQQTGETTLLVLTVATRENDY